MVVDLGFLTQFAPLSLELGRLLEVRFVPGEPANETPVGLALAMILERQNADDLIGRDVHYFRMLGLAKHLKEIEQHDPALLAAYRRKLTDPNLGNFVGTRFEIYTAASLIRGGVQFQRRSQGGPDFVLVGRFAGLGVECASLHLVDPTKGGYAVDKLADVVEVKAAKDYAISTNVLALDTTNIQAASIDHAAQPAIDPANVDRLADIVNSSGFGSLLCFWTQNTVESGKVVASTARYARIDCDDVPDDLERFLDAVYSGRGHQGDPPNWQVPFLT